MGEAKRRRDQGAALSALEAGPTLFRRQTADDTIAEFERLIDAGLVEGFLQLVLVRTPVSGVLKVELSTIDVTARQAWDMLNIARDAMGETMGFGDQSQGRSSTDFPGPDGGR